MKCINKIKSRYLIKVPNTLKLVYCEKRKMLYIKSNLSKFSTNSFIINLKLKLYFISDRAIYITNVSFAELSNKEKKNLNSLRSNTYSYIKKIFYQFSFIVFKKLKLIGIGFKVFNKNYKKFNIIEFKLGYSHSIFFKVPSEISCICHKTNVLFIKGFSNDTVSQIAALIKNYKLPEVYKGKGILYQNETVNLKQGKKI